MTILAERLRESKLTNQQHRMTGYFLKNERWIGDMSSMNVAREIGISDASIIRLSRTVGYKGFTDLKNDIYNSSAREAGAAIRNIQLSDRLDTLSGKFNDQNIPDTFVGLMNYNITKAFHQNPVGSYDALTDMILMSKCKYIIGLHGCMRVAGHFARLLGFAVNQVITLPHNETEAMGILQSTGPRDIFILFSFARYYEISMSLVNMARSHKARICVVTGSPLAPMIPRSDISFIAETSRISFFSSAIGIEMIGEYIVTLVHRRDNKEYRKRAKEKDALTIEFRMP